MRTFFFQFTKFLSVGVIATICHYVAMIASVETGLLSEIPGSVLGAIIGAIVSYILNRRHTFRSDRAHSQAIPRFFTIASLAVIANTLLMIIFVGHLNVPYIPAQIITSGLIIVITFLGNRFWTFHDKKA